jgi:alpha-L-fucosidase
MLKFFAIVLMLCFAGCVSQKNQKLKMDDAINDSKAAHLARPTKAQYDYHERERMMFIHLSPATWQGEEWDKEITPLQEINPRKLNTDQWVEAAKSFDAKTILFVAKHVGGFCWWQTKTSEYSIKNTPYKQGDGDVLDDLIASVRRNGLQMGIYIYPGDQAHWGNRVGTGGITNDTSKQEAYNKVFRGQYTEVLSRFNEYPHLLNELWFDGSCRIDLNDIVEKYAPDALIFQGPLANVRWCGNEEGVLPYPAWNSLSTDDLRTGVATVNQSNPDGDAWAPLEVDVPNMGHRWIWSPDNEADMRSVQDLVKLYYLSVGRGGVFLLNASPDTTGLIPQSHMSVYKEFGAEIGKRFANPSGETSGLGNKYVIKFNRPLIINQFMIREDYRYGERIRAFEVKVKNGKGEWQLVNRGSAVGYKRIVVFDDVLATEVSLDITESAGTPIVRNFSVYKLDGNNDFLKFSDDNVSFIEEINWLPCPFVMNEKQAVVDISDKISIPAQYRFKINSLSTHPITHVGVAYDGVFVLDEMVTEGDGIYNFTHTAATTKEHKITVHVEFDTDAKNAGFSFFIEEKKFLK